MCVGRGSGNVSIWCLFGFWERAVCRTKRLKGYRHSVIPTASTLLSAGKRTKLSIINMCDEQFMVISYDTVVTGTVCWCTLNVNPFCSYLLILTVSLDDFTERDDVFLTGRLTQVTPSSAGRSSLCFWNCRLSDFACFMDVVLLSLNVIHYLLFLFMLYSRLQNQPAFRDTWSWTVY